MQPNGSVYYKKLHWTETRIVQNVTLPLPPTCSDVVYSLHLRPICPDQSIHLHVRDKSGRSFSTIMLNGGTTHCFRHVPSPIFAKVTDFMVLHYRHWTSGYCHCDAISKKSGRNPGPTLGFPLSSPFHRCRKTLKEFLSGLHNVMFTSPSNPTPPALFFCPLSLSFDCGVNGNRSVLISQPTRKQLHELIQLYDSQDCSQV